MVYSDIQFRQNIQNKQANEIEILNQSLKHITSEEIIELRSVMKVLEGNNNLINQFKDRIP